MTPSVLYCSLAWGIPICSYLEVSHPLTISETRELEIF